LAKYDFCKYLGTNVQQWEFHDFIATQILREINFGHIEALKLPFWPL